MPGFFSEDAHPYFPHTCDQTFMVQTNLVLPGTPVQNGSPTLGKEV